MTRLSLPLPRSGIGRTASERLSAWLLVGAALLLCVFLILPLGVLLMGSLVDRTGALSLVRFVEFAATPGMGRAVWNTIWVALVVTVITVPLAFLYAYAIQRACLPLRGVWRIVGLSALLGPSLVGAISFIQWFGTQGVLKSWLGDNSVDRKSVVDGKTVHVRGRRMN